DERVAAAVRRHLASQPLLVGIAGSHHHVAGANRVSVFGAERDAARRGRKLHDARAIVYGYTALVKPAQQSVGHALGIERPAEMTQDRRWRINAVTRGTVVVVQPFDIESMPQPHLEFVLQLRLVSSFAREVQAARSAIATVTQIARQSTQRRDRVRTRAI